MSRKELVREFRDLLKILVKVARLEKERPGEIDLFVSVTTKRTDGKTFCGRTFSEMWEFARKIVAVERETVEVWE